MERFMLNLDYEQIQYPRIWQNLELEALMSNHMNTQSEKMFALALLHEIII